MPIAGWELRGAIRSRWVLGGSVVFALASLAVSLLGLRSLRSLGLSGVGPASAGLVNLVVLIPPLMGLLLGANSIVGARERGVLAMVVSQPVSRFTYVAGTFFGLVAAVWMTIVVGFSLTAAVLAGVAKIGDLWPLIALGGTALVVSAVSIALGMAVSALSQSRMQAAAAATAIWFLFAFGMDMALAGISGSVRLGPGSLMLAVLVNPLEAGRILALLASNPDGASLGPFGAYLVATYRVGGSALIILAAASLWIAIPLWIAWRRLVRCDI